MTTLVDGPAAGEVLMLRRSPIYLRVTRAAGGTWDGLDQLDDEARSDETIVVYKREGEASYCHINRRGKPGGGVFHGGRYLVVTPQPADADVRANRAWRAWVGRQIGATVAEDGTVPS